jgi:serine/threonine-protein kinase RsbW
LHVRLDRVIRLRVPGTLTYRNIAVRVVTDAAKRVGAEEREPAHDVADDEFESQVVSAFGEAFNNIAIHGYDGAKGDVDITIDIQTDAIAIELVDGGRSFDPNMIPSPELETLPEGGMGLFIMRSFMDEVEYRPGPPNKMKLVKRRGKVT